MIHDDVTKLKHFPRYWPFVRGIHRSPVNSPHKGQWRGALMFYLICVWINKWANNREAGDLRRYRVHHNVSVMIEVLSATTQKGAILFNSCLTTKYFKTPHYLTLLWGDSTGLQWLLITKTTCGFPSHGANNAESVSLLWRHHESPCGKGLGCVKQQQKVTNCLTSFQTYDVSSYDLRCVWH